MASSSGVYIDVMFSTAPAIFHCFVGGVGWEGWGQSPLTWVLQKRKASNMNLHDVFYYINSNKMHMLQSLFYFILFAYVSNHIKTKTDPTRHSNQCQLFHDSSRQQYGYVHHSLFYITYCISRRIYIINNCNFNLIYRYLL
jgi:hypothetical protein